MRLQRIPVLLILLAVPALAESALRIEGESYVRVGGPSRIRVLDRDGALGGKVMSYWDDHGVWAEWEFELPAAGSYALSFRYAAAADTERRLELNGALPHPAAEAVRFPATGAYTKHDVCTLVDAAGAAALLDLAAGKHVLRLTNVASTGLAMDAILVHPPTLPFTDQPLPDAEAAALRELVPVGPATAPVSDDTRLAKGRVLAAFAAGHPHAVCVAETLFFVDAHDGQTPAESAHLRTAALSVHRAVRDGVLCVLITDGQAAYLVTAASPPRPAPLELRPHAYRRGGQLVRLAAWRGRDGQPYYPALGLDTGPAPAWTLGTAHVAAVPDLLPAKRATGTVLTPAALARVTVVKLSPAAWRESGLEATVTTDGAIDTICSSRQGLPGLAAFYGYADFELRFEWHGDTLARCDLTETRSGERLPLFETRK